MEPTRTGKPLFNLSITGCLLPRDERGQPVLCQFLESESDTKYLPIFSTIDKLVLACRKYKLEYASVGMIEDGYEFIMSLEENRLPYKIHVVLDPHSTSGGKTRFTQIAIPYH